MKQLIKNFLNHIKSSLKIYKPLLFSSLLLLTIGLIMFGSAALGVLERNEIKFYSIIKSQFIYALLAGSLAMLLGIFINVKYYFKFSYVFYALAIILNVLVFIPGLNRYHNGAHRWLDIGNFSLQPSELLKIPIIIMTAWIMIKFGEEIKNKSYGLLYFLAIITPVAILLFLQKDTGTMLVIALTSFAVYFVGGANWRDIIILFLISIIGLFGIIHFRPYAMNRYGCYNSQEI